ncbi:hypothetical protein V1517DRAFT_320624 [Lipomyces orientalis]|uniref:Uncharacterized protein n=1 Tax=Lipomyces orientalis TaxID=1233043 RepID=A0ACC3TRJ7_9ASCO
MGPTGPVVANAPSVIDLTDSPDTSPASSERAAARQCGGFQGDLSWPPPVTSTPIPQQSDIQGSSIRPESASGGIQPVTTAATHQAEVIDVDELPDPGVRADEPAFRFNGDLRTLRPSNMNSHEDNEDDIAITFSRRRVDPLPRYRRLARTPIPVAESSPFLRLGPHHNPSPNRHSARSPSAVGVLDLDTITSRPDLTPQSEQPTRTTVGVGGGFGDHMTRRAAVVTTRRSSRGHTRVLLPVFPPRASATQQIYGYFPSARPRARADIEQLDRLQNGFLDGAPRAFVRPHLDYGAFDDDHDWSIDNFDDDYLAEAAEVAAGMAAAEVMALRRRAEETRVNIAKPAVPPPRKGYTRMISSGTRLVCPDCNHILGAPSKPSQEVPKDEDERSSPNATDIHRTIWAGKCGHVYCGNCATKYRKARRGRKQTVGICVVPGCKQNLTGARGMFELFA